MSDQDKREKVIKGLECHVNGDPQSRCHKCPYWGTGIHGLSECSAMAADALELLKEQEQCLAEMKEDLEDTLKDNQRLAELVDAQEPRVMTLEEVKSLERDAVVWYEFNGVNKQRPRIVDQVYDSGIIFTDGGHWRFNADAYGKKFRLWTSRPDQATREATPWND